MVIHPARLPSLSTLSGAGGAGSGGCLGCGPVGQVAPVAVEDPAYYGSEVFGLLATVRCCMVDDELVAFDAASRRGLLLNASAALVLTSLDGRTPLTDVVASLAEDLGMPAEALRADVDRAVAGFVEWGLVELLEAGGSEGSEPAPDPGSEPGTFPAPDGDAELLPPAGEVRLAELDSRQWTLVLPGLSVGELSVCLRTDSPEMAARLPKFLTGFPSADEAPQLPAGGRERDLAILQPNGAGEVVIAVDGVVVDEAPDAAAAVGAILYRLDLFASQTQDLLAFHGGAVERDGRVVAVVGFSGHGKSTLTAAFTSDGWAYLSDEVALVDPASLFVHPYPKDLDLGDAAFEQLGLAGGAEVGDRKRKLPPSELGSVSRGGQLSLVVVLDDQPLFAAPGRPGVVPLWPAEAMVALMPLVFEPSLSFGDNFESLGELCLRVPVLRLGRAPLPAMVDTVAEALATR